MSTVYHIIAYVSVVWTHSIIPYKRLYTEVASNMFQIFKNFTTKLTNLPLKRKKE